MTKNGVQVTFVSPGMQIIGGYTDNYVLSCNHKNTDLSQLCSKIFVKKGTFQLLKMQEVFGNHNLLFGGQKLVLSCQLVLLK